ncbi:MAG: hypothetical protein OXF27_18605 [Acidobacteria bacterium]|nr:hypothetical protein [Acidobacteriota bacterium]
MNCRYCGEQAGFLRREHEACRNRHRRALSAVIDGVRTAAEETTHADTGTLCVTTKHVYFAGASERFRVRHDRIVSYTPMEDGFSLTRDRANARPELFRTGDGWFTYNIVANARNLES